jgi:hypothetical protein
MLVHFSTGSFLTAIYAFILEAGCCFVTYNTSNWKALPIMECCHASYVDWLDSWWTAGPNLGRSSSVWSLVLWCHPQNLKYCILLENIFTTKLCTLIHMKSTTYSQLSVLIKGKRCVDNPRLRGHSDHWIQKFENLCIASKLFNYLKKYRTYKKKGCWT